MTDDNFLFGGKPEEQPEPAAKRGRLRKVKEALPEGKIDFEQLLSEEDKTALDEKAREHVLEAAKKVASEEYFKKAVTKERSRHHPEEEMREILIDLPGHSMDIRINGAQYFHGSIYNVPMSLYRSLNDIMARANEHEDDVGNVNRDRYKRPARNFSLRPGMENFQHPNETIMRV